MKILDARRLTGLNLDSDGPGVVLEVRWPDAVAREAGIQHFLRDLSDFAAELAAALPDGLSAHPVVRRWADGLSATLVFPAAIDRLYAAVRLGEKLLEDPSPAGGEPLTGRGEAGWAAWLEARHAAWKKDEAPEVSPALLSLAAWAQRHGVPFLWDDDEVSLGFGASARSWPAAAPPEPGTLVASAFHDVPKVLITGTNGKTTTSRMLTRILRHAGLHVGATSTDALTFDEVVFETGDWTGPGAARRILRHPGVSAAVLETARGGILRRGLGVSPVDAAAITNVAADHLGEHGITDVAGMAATKATVWRAVRPDGRAIVNAACDPSWAAACALTGEPLTSGRWVLFAGRPEVAPAAARLAAHRAAGGETWVLEGLDMVRRLGEVEVARVGLADMPAGWGGLAHHNLENALVAGALATSLGVGPEVIGAALATFGLRPTDNAGRAELWRLGPHAVVLDFGHNGHGLEALAPMLRGLARRLASSDAAPGASAPLLVSVGMAGDREASDASAMQQGVLAIGAEAVWLRPLVGYERGRDPGFMEALLEGALRDAGFDPARVHRADSEPAFLAAASAVAAGPSVLALLVHLERDEVRAWLTAHGARPATISDFGG